MATAAKNARTCDARRMVLLPVEMAPRVIGRPNERLTPVMRRGNNITRGFSQMRRARDQLHLAQPCLHLSVALENHATSALYARNRSTHRAYRRQKLDRGEELKTKRRPRGGESRPPLRINSRAALQAGAKRAAEDRERTAGAGRTACSGGRGLGVSGFASGNNLTRSFSQMR